MPTLLMEVANCGKKKYLSARLHDGAFQKRVIFISRIQVLISTCRGLSHVEKKTSGVIPGTSYDCIVISFIIHCPYFYI